MWKNQYHKPTMTGNGENTNYKNGDFKLVYYCFTGINHGSICNNLQGSLLDWDV